MPRPKRPPRYPTRPHSTGQARIVLDKKSVYLGLFDSPESHERYRRVVAEWLAGQGPQPPAKGLVSIEEVLAAYWLFVEGAESPYQKRGKLTNQVGRIRQALGPVRQLYGSTPAAEFSAKKLLAVRRHMATEMLCSRCRGAGQWKGKPCPRCQGTGKRPWSRNFTNSCIGCIQTAFEWAVQEELIPGTVAHALRVVKAIRQGTPGVRDTPDVRPVPWPVVEQTLPQLLPTVADMVRVQYLGDMRPCEVCLLRVCDLDREGRLPNGQTFPGLWVYLVPAEVNKMAHKGQSRIVFFGAQAQAVLTPYLERRQSGQYVFSPREAVEQYLKSKGYGVNHSHQRMPREHYTTDSYDRAVAKAARRAGVEHWHPNQLRHLRNTELRAAFGLATASACSGHDSLETTLWYAETDLARAAEAMRKVG